MGGRFERSERLEHQTLGVQRLAVRSEDYWDYKPQQRVKTIDGVTGVVKHVEDGPFPGSEEYHVELEHGLGGGRYTASQLSPAPITTAAMEQTAAADYPELAQILVERPDPALLHVTAKADPFGDDDEDDDSNDDGGDSDADSDDSDDDGGDSDADSDDSDDDENSEDSDDDSSDEDDDSDDAPPWAKKASSLFSDLVVTAATDADFRFHVTAAWRDVVEKAKRIRSEGRLRVTLASDGLVFGEVKGDHEVYETGLQRMPGKMAAHAWSCGCKWGAYHWGAPDDFSRFAGRMCSHALALQYEAQSRGMFGRDINVDEHKPSWVPRKVVVRYDIDADKHRLAPSTAKTAMWGWEDDEDSEEHDSKAKEWDDIHSGLDGIHRGLGVHLPPDDHAIVHDESRPVEERAHHLLKSLPRSLHGQEGSVGWHWTSDDGVAESFGETGSQNTAVHHPSGQHWEGTSVVLHAHTPDREDINEHPDERAGEVYGYYDHGEREVPLHPGASVHLKGISWKSMHDVHDERGDLVEEHSDREYTRHDFPGGHHVRAFLRQPPADSALSVVSRAAVAAGENQDEVLLALAAAGMQIVAAGGPLVNQENVESNRDWESHGLGPWDSEDEDFGDDRNVHEWYHGAPHRIDEFQHEGEHAGEAHSTHWNNALGSHWAANEQLAGTFGPHVHHAELHISNPKHYASEYDMDREAYSHEYEAGNTPDRHDPEHHQRWAGDPSLGHNEDLRHQPDEIEHQGQTVDNRPRFMRWLSTHPDRAGIAARFKEHLQAQGHDGITYGNEIEKNSFDGKDSKNLCAIPFHPGQIKVTQSHPVTRTDEYGVEEDHPCLPRSQRNHMRHTANANAPFGEPSGTSYQLPRPPGATQKRKAWENPASAGPLAGADPVGWNRQLPLQAYAAEHSLFEPGGAEAVLHDEPEGALPSTDGVQIPSDDEALSPTYMTAGLKRQALKDFSLAEQQALINEGENVRAANLDRLNITGTHYEDLEQVLKDQEDDTTWLM